MQGQGSAYQGEDRRREQPIRAPRTQRRDLACLSVYTRFEEAVLLPEINRLIAGTRRGVYRAAEQSTLCEGINRTLFDIEYPFMCCIGVGDHACFVTNGDYQVIEVIVYTISEKTWSRLPNCPLDDDIVHNIWEGSVMAFEPRPDMKVL